MRLLFKLFLLGSCFAILYVSRTLTEEIVDKNRDATTLEGQEDFSPKFIDFSDYKALFKKHYKSVRETIVRRLFYLGRAMQTFISGIQYKRGLSTYYLAVNSMSDWTDEEVSKVLLKPIHLSEKISIFEENEAGSKGEQEDQIMRKKRNVCDQYSRVQDFLGKNVNINRYKNNRKLPDRVFIDHRQSKCLNFVKSQKLCGCCYAHSSMAFFEWLYCQSTGKTISFSEQYIVDCGWLVGFNGCEGGESWAMGEFVKNYGLKFEKNYPYVGKENKCKLNSSSRRMRMNKIRRTRITLDKFPEQLKESPIIVAVYIKLDFLQYKGGVDDGYGKRDSLHAMLLVGHGRANGLDYWLLRNSHGTEWGQEGHYRLSKQISSLICNKRGFIFEGEFEEEKRLPNIKSLLLLDGK